MVLKSFWYQFFINTPFAAAARRQRGAFHRLCQWTDSMAWLGLDPNRNRNRDRNRLPRICRLRELPSRHSLFRPGDTAYRQTASIRFLACLCRVRQAGAPESLHVLSIPIAIPISISIVPWSPRLVDVFFWLNLLRVYQCGTQEGTQERSMTASPTFLACTPFRG